MKPNEPKRSTPWPQHTLQMACLKKQPRRKKKPWISFSKRVWIIQTSKNGACRSNVDSPHIAADRPGTTQQPTCHSVTPTLTAATFKSETSHRYPRDTTAQS